MHQNDRYVHRNDAEQSKLKMKWTRLNIQPHPFNLMDKINCIGYFINYSSC